MVSVQRPWAGARPLLPVAQGAGGTHPGPATLAGRSQPRTHTETRPCRQPFTSLLTRGVWEEIEPRRKTTQSGENLTLWSRPVATVSSTLYRKMLPGPCPAGCACSGPCGDLSASGPRRDSPAGGGRPRRLWPRGPGEAICASCGPAPRAWHCAYALGPSRPCA